MSTADLCGSAVSNTALDLSLNGHPPVLQQETASGQAIIAQVVSSLPSIASLYSSSSGLSNAWPVMLSRVARVEIKVAENLYCRTQCAFLFNLLVFFRASKCIYLCI